MTEQELIDQMTALNANAQAVLTGIQALATQPTGTVTFTLYGGVTVAMPSLQQMQDDLVRTLTLVVKTANYTALDGEKVVCDTSAGSFTLTLPASPVAGVSIVSVVHKNGGTSYALTVARNGQNIEGLAEDLTCTTSDLSFDLIFLNTTKGWVVA